MKKIYLVILGLLLAFSGNAYAADINDVSSQKWLDHVAQMQVMRQQILRLLTRQDPTPQDREMLAAVQKSFEEKKAEWDQYLQDVAAGKYENKTEEKTYCQTCGKLLCNCGKGPICKKCGKRICNCKRQYKHKHMKKSQKEGVYHRYDKSPRRHFRKKYHRYDKTPRKAPCIGVDPCLKDEIYDKPEYKHKKRYHYKKKMHDCSGCSSKMSCGRKMYKKVKCNGGVDCPSCPNYKTERCCKVSGNCSSHHGKDHKMHKGCD